MCYSLFTNIKLDKYNFMVLKVLQLNGDMTGIKVYFSSRQDYLGIISSLWETKDPFKMDFEFGNLTYWGGLFLEEWRYYSKCKLE